MTIITASVEQYTGNPSNHSETKEKKGKCCERRSRWPMKSIISKRYLYFHCSTIHNSQGIGTT